LHAQLAALPFWPQIPVAHQDKNTGTGGGNPHPEEDRGSDPAGPTGQGLLFPHAQQAVRITRTRTTQSGGKSQAQHRNASRSPR